VAYRLVFGILRGSVACGPPFVPVHFCGKPGDSKSVVSTQFANLARTWIRLADELERTLAFIDALEEETEPQRRTG
jgi:hypothetical protein